MKLNTKTSSISEFWAEVPAVVKLIIYIVLVILIIVLLVWLYKKWNAGHRNKLLNNSTATTTTPGGQPVSVNLGTIASQINSAFHSGLFGMTEDEDAAIAALTNCPKQLIPDLSALYFQLYDSNLKEDFQEYVSTEEWQKIEYLFI